MILQAKIRAALQKWADTAGADPSTYNDQDKLAEFLESELEIPQRVDAAEHHIVGDMLSALTVHHVPIRIEELPSANRAIRIGGHTGGVELLLAAWQEVTWHAPMRSDQPSWSRGHRLNGDVDLMSITLKSFSRGG